MCAALEAGVTRLLRLGGAHAIAALAYGTATIPRVDKIVGPGNAYVAAAKALVVGRLRHRLLRRAERDRRRLDDRPAGVDRRRPHRAGRARSGRARDPGHARRAAGARRRRAKCATQMPADGPGAAGARAQRRHHRDARRSTRRSTLMRAHGARARRVRLGRPSPPGSRAPARCSSATTARRRPATTPPARTTCCRRAARRAAAAG